MVWLSRLSTPGRPGAREHDAPEHIYRSTNIYPTSKWDEEYCMNVESPRPLLLMAVDME
jgi:hypothetical protein